jgi:hypothetical protein
LDPEVVAGDPAGIEIAKVKNFLGATPVFLGQTERNIPGVYERPGTAFLTLASKRKPLWVNRPRGS